MKKSQLLLPALIIGLITVIFGTIYITQQQSLRIGANDPQIQMAEDAAAALDNGATTGSLVGSRVDLAHSLAPFIIIYNKSGQAVDGNGYLGSQTPTAPLGVLMQSDGRGYSFVTWQPQNGIRIASVTVASGNYYVLAGRSLKEVEKRENSLTVYVLFGWVVSILIILASFYMYHFKKVKF